MKRYIFIIVIMVGVVLAGAAYAFVGPSSGQTPGSGGGLFNVDSSRNIGFGTASPTPTDAFDTTSTESGSTAHGYIFTVASTTNPGIGVKNLSYNSGGGIQYLWSARNFGAFQLFRQGGGYLTKVIFDISPIGRVGVSYPSFNIGSGVRFQVGDGAIQAPSFIGVGTNLTSIDPSNFLADSAFAGGGNYAIPGSLAVGTTTVIGLPTNGLFVNGNVGIGTASPIAKLDITGPESDSNAEENALLILRDSGGASSYERWGLRIGNLGQLHFDTESGGTDYTRVTFERQNGRVGIGTSTPSHSLTVYGSIAITAKTGQLDLTASSSQSIAMASGNITGVNKLTVATIDPLYQIGTSKYATYASSIVGGVYEEYIGRGQLTITDGNKDDFYEYIIDFNAVEKGSDLWVWHQIVDFSSKRVHAFATPYSSPVPIAYEVRDSSVVFRGTEPVAFSYRLVGKRHDWRSWPTYAKDQTERPSFIIDK